MIKSFMTVFQTRSGLLSAGIIIACLSILAFYTIQKNTEFENTRQDVEYIREVINSTSALNKNMAQLISQQRSYLITGQDKYMEDFIAVHTNGGEILSALDTLIQSNETQKERVANLQKYYLDLVALLSDRIQLQYQEAITDSGPVDDLEEQITATSQDLLQTEYNILSTHLYKLERIQSNTLFGILVGIILSGLLVGGLNLYLHRLRQANKLADDNLIVTQDRLNFALMATGDGVFDWDIQSDTLTVTPSFAQMMGYDVADIPTNRNGYSALIHPDDRDRVVDYLNKYIGNELSEYCQEYRVQCQSGQYIWVESIANALRDDNDQATRLIGIHRDITSYKYKEKSLEKEAEHANKKSEDKTAFLAHMSHEIRTPLTSIAGIAEILNKKITEFGDREQSLIKTLVTSTKSLKDLINDILDFSKIEKGEVDIVNDHFVLSELHSEIISIMSVLSNEKGLKFHIDETDLGQIQYYGDKTRLRQILINLIGNAIKFTDKGSVSVNVSKHHVNDIPVLKYQIIDTGIGIDPDHIEKIFEDFQQGDDTVSRKYGGTGLGLPISKKLANIMGGDIHVSSTLGEGSVFDLILPLENSIDLSEGDDDLSLSQKINDKLKSAIQNEKNILIVEDYDGNIAILTYLMDEIGLKYQIANNGQEAIDLWKTHHFDLILMDVQMPVMDGLTATQTIRELEKTNQFDTTPIIGMTAHALVEDKDTCINAGMTDYVAKPIDMVVFTDKIMMHLNTKNKKAA